MDEAWARDEPNATRWDYGLGYRHAAGVEEAHWIEVHPATDKEADRVLEKLRWLKDYLRQHAPSLLAMTFASQRGPAYVWIHTGYDRVRRGSRARKRLSEAGLRGPMRDLELP